MNLMHFDKMGRNYMVKESVIEWGIDITKWYVWDCVRCVCGAQAPQSSSSSNSATYLKLHVCYRIRSNPQNIAQINNNPLAELPAIGKGNDYAPLVCELVRPLCYEPRIDINCQFMVLRDNWVNLVLECLLYF